MTAERLVQIQQLIIDAVADELLIADEQAHLVSSAGLANVPNPFACPSALKQFVLALARQAGIRLDPMCGSAGGSLGDGAWRWHCLLPPLSRDGVLFSLRRHRFDALAINHFGLDDVVKERLLMAMHARHHLLIVGPTGSGKSSLLMALLRACALQERVVIIESLPELPRASPSWVRLAARGANIEGLGVIGMQQLLVEALRLRPDRLVIGEVRGPEAATLVDALATGHAGLLATLHAGCARSALQRLKRWDEHATDVAAADPILIVEMQRGAPPVVRAVRHLNE